VIAPSTGALIRTVLIGATGRMGANILRLLPRFPALQLAGAVASEGSAGIGEDALGRLGTASCGIKVSAALPPLLDEADLALDFSSADAAAANLAACVAAGVPLLLGTTGLPEELQGPLAGAARSIALLVAPNTSLGANLLLELVARAARALPRAYDIEVLETHHRDKIDAPSGTALALGRAAAEGRAVSLAQVAVHERHGRSSARTPGQIGFAVVRGGDVVGEHEVLFLGEGESLTLRHRATDRSVFARGALMAGQWLARQPPGRYEMHDILSQKQ
jgi:4-hydroxy-tetrahydrodipicolinate reductase